MDVYLVDAEGRGMEDVGSYPGDAPGWLVDGEDPAPKGNSELARKLRAAVENQKRKGREGLKVKVISG